METFWKSLKSRDICKNVLDWWKTEIKPICKFSFTSCTKQKVRKKRNMKFCNQKCGDETKNELDQGKPYLQEYY